MPSDLRELARAVEEIPSSHDDPTHGKIVAALSLLSRLVRDNDEGAARRIDELATKLMRMPPHDRGHADVVRAAIGEALESFMKMYSRQPDPVARDAYVAAQRAHTRLSGDRPLRFQIHDVAAAMRALTNMAAITRDLPPMFALPSDETRIGYDAAELEKRSTRLSELVAELASERRWEAASTNAAIALDALADALEVSPLTIDAARWRGVVSAVRYEAQRLEREGAISVDRSDHIKAGLAAGLTGLDAIAPVHASVAAKHLIATARAATDRIDAHTMFMFQRGLIQDAFRALSAALVVIASGDQPAPRERGMAASR